MRASLEIFVRRFVLVADWTDHKYRQAGTSTSM
jgi:hypothetical protein